jgi:hypothetical protein
MNAMNRSVGRMGQTGPAPVERLAVFLDNCSVEVTALRCPTCQKLLAKCAVRGMIEIVCPRCHAMVRNIFP